ncbi:hypothetical protein LXL04_032650 [Taraxacum kok-saghyz]
MHNGNPIAQSIVILEYIDDVWKGCIPALKAVVSTGDEKIIAEACKQLQILENELKLKGTKFFGGDNINLIDIAGLGIREEVAGIKFFTEDKFPKLTKWAHDFVNCEAVKDALPPREHTLGFYNKMFGKINGVYSGEGRGGEIEGTRSNGEELQMVDDPCQSMSRVIPISSSHLTPYRVVIILCLIILGFFLQYRLTHPVKDAYPLWVVFVICEVWFAFTWILDQFPKWSPVERETFLDRLALRFDREGEPSQLALIDFFVSTVDPLKEPPLITANTVLSILTVEYPVDKVSCYVSDDASAMLTFESLSKMTEFAKKKEKIKTCEEKVSLFESDNQNMAKELKLYSAGSPFVCRVKIVLNMKGIKYENIEEDLSNKSADLLKYNPVHKKVPVLLHNGKPISESLVIVEYIDDVWKEVPILPHDPYQRALDRFWAKFIDDKCNAATYKVFGSNGDEQVVTEACEQLQVLENELKVKGTKFFGGDNINLVDISGTFIAYWLGILEEATDIKFFTNDKFPILTKWADDFVKCDYFPSLKNKGKFGDINTLPTTPTAIYINRSPKHLRIISSLN